MASWATRTCSAAMVVLMALVLGVAGLPSNTTLPSNDTIPSNDTVPSNTEMPDTNTDSNNPESVDVITTPEPETAVNTSVPGNLTITPECQREIDECKTLIKPGPQGIPDVQTACAGSTDTSCTIKYLECKILTPRTLRNRSSTNRRLCLGLKVADCEKRAQTCNQMLHPSPALHANMTDCMTRITGCPLHPRVDQEARDFVKQCLEPSFRADIENLNDAVVKEEVLKNFDSCYDANEMPEITKCLVKKCINVVSL